MPAPWVIQPPVPVPPSEPDKPEAKAEETEAKAEENPKAKPRKKTTIKTGK